MVDSGMMICSFYLKTRYAKETIMYPLNGRFVTRNGERAYDGAIEMLSEFCRKHFSYDDDKVKKRLFSINEKSVAVYDGNDYQALSFTVSSGAYGIESNITDRATKQVRYRRTADDADMKEFRCVVFIPKDVNGVEITKGIMIFQTIAVYGVKTITVNNMREFFAKLGLTLETRSVSVRAFIEKLEEQGSLYKVTLIENRISPDPSDNIFINAGREVRSYIRPRLKPDWFKKFLDLVERKPDADVFEIEDQEYEDIKVTFKLNDRYRTVALRYLDRFSVVEDLPNSVYQDGRLNEEALISHMLQTAEAYKEKMVFNR